MLASLNVLFQQLHDDHRNDNISECMCVRNPPSSESWSRCPGVTATLRLRFDASSVIRPANPHVCTRPAYEQDACSLTYLQIGLQAGRLQLVLP
jgi:hypothetical protein